MRLAITIMVIALVVAVACPCFAGSNTAAKVAIHVRAHTSKGDCTLDPAITECGEIVSNYEGFSFDAFPVFYDLTSWLGVEYGVMWPDWTYSAAFTSCSDLVIGVIALPGEGSSHTWFECKSDWAAFPSYLWLYADAPGHVCVVNHPIGSVQPGIYILDCSENLDSPMLTPSEEVWSMCAGVYGETGGDACTGVSTEPTTWGGIKQIFR